MTLFTDSIFLTNDTEGFRVCREQRTSNTATMSVILCRAGYIDVYYHGRMIRIGKDDLLCLLVVYNFNLIVVLSTVPSDSFTVAFESKNR